jgi:hypothetical protein
MEVDGPAEPPSAAEAAEVTYLARDVATKSAEGTRAARCVLRVAWQRDSFDVTLTDGEGVWSKQGA